MSKLSSAAQAVINSAVEAGGGYGHATPVLHARLAAALRAAADQVVPEEREPDVPDFPDSDQIAPYYKWLCRRKIRAEILAIASELESHV